MKKQILIPTLVLISLAISAKVIAATTSTPVLPPSVFRDDTTGIALSIQLIPNRPDTGAFDFFVPKTGHYQGTLLLKGKISCDEKEDCEEDDDDRDTSKVTHLQGSLTAKFYALDGSAPVDTHMRIEGKINTKYNTATINVWITNNHYHLRVKKGDAQAAAKIATQSLQDTKSQNWPALYGLLSSQVQGAMTQTQFTQAMTGSPKVIATSLNGVGQQSTVNGFTYLAQPVILTVQNSGGTTSVLHGTEFLVLEQGTWRLLSTNTPTP